METLSNLITHKQFMVAKGSVCYKQAYSKKTLAKARGWVDQMVMSRPKVPLS